MADRGRRDDCLSGARVVARRRLRRARGPWWALLVVLPLLLAGCGLPGVIAVGGTLPPPRAATTPAALPPIHFPQDEAPHRDLTEWWYYTGHFATASATYGFELTFFQTLRGALPPFYAAHFAVSDITRGAFHYDQRTAFGSWAQIPPPGSTGGFNLSVGGWAMRGVNGHDVLDAAMTWETIDWILGFAKVPVLLKGILTPADAELAAEHGVAGILVSNHGARNLDTTPATIEALPRVVEAVDGRLPVLLDGGIRRGTDVLKALALGARAVLVGRPYLWGLAAAGAEGVAGVLTLLRTELLSAMALCGCPTLAGIDGSVLWPGPAKRSRS